MPVCEPLPVNSKISSVSFNRGQVRDKIMKLKPGTAQGPDGIPARVLKDNCDSLCVPFTIIFNKSMEAGCVPHDGKLANVTPIFKKGSKSKLKNYRPVSLTSICCKLMESIIRDQVVTHLEINYLIKASQHGFMKNKSCTTNLLEFLETITKIIDEGDPADIVYLELRCMVLKETF